MTAGLADITGSMTTTAENPYLRDAVLTASPEQLQLMLYDGAIRFATQAHDAIRRKDFETSFEKLTRAQNIILEMQGGLNYDINRPLCERMSAIYNFVYRKLVDANVNRDAAHIDDALKVLHVERETWRILVDKVGRLRGGAPAAAEVDPQTTAFSAEV
jgi:flagellar protein FliS